MWLPTLPGRVTPIPGISKMISRSFIRSFCLQHPPKGVLQYEAIILFLSIVIILGALVATGVNDTATRGNTTATQSNASAGAPDVAGSSDSTGEDIAVFLAEGGYGLATALPKYTARSSSAATCGTARCDGFAWQGDEIDARPRNTDSAASCSDADGVGGCFSATRYGDGRLRADGSRGPDYNGLSLGCGASAAGSAYKDGLYHSDDPTILAAPPSRYAEWPCGTRLRLCVEVAKAGQAGAADAAGGESNSAGAKRCIEVERVDSCPGCGANQVDLSEAAITWLCSGDPTLYARTGETCDHVSGISIEVIGR